MVDSIHAARWARQFDPSEVEFTLFPSGPNRRVHSIFKELGLEIVPFGGLLSVPLWVADRIFDDRIRGYLLRLAIRRINPDFIHALELQHAGYIVSRALEEKNIKNTFIATNYGSDIFWFQRFPKHLVKIKKMLARADKYSAECFRDIDLAKKYGFNGATLPVFPNAGIFTPEQLGFPLIPSSQRNVIAIKGYEGWAGRASVAVDALRLLKHELSGFRIIFYSCNKKTIRLLKRAKRKTALNIEWHSKGALTHNEMLSLFGSAKIYIGVSLSDGISTSLLEAMLMGAFPIQTSTACVDEWIIHGSTGLELQEANSELLARVLTEALTITSLSSSTYMEANRNLISQKLSEQQLRQIQQDFYWSEN
jgi:glycosyltransferase involved in cell wall biosynthesis